jgi:ribosomal protein L19E
MPHRPRKATRPYWQYKPKITGKTVTRRLTSARATQYARWIDSGRALRDLLAQVSDQARDLILATAPEDRHTGS